MTYTIKAHPTMYKNTLFRSRLEARWAAFFDLAGWDWAYEPVDLEGWTPDFRLTLEGLFDLYVEVKPYDSLNQFEGHFAQKMLDNRTQSKPSPALFGNNPQVTSFTHDDGIPGRAFPCNINSWVDNADDLWRQAGNATRFLAPTEHGRKKPKCVCPNCQYCVQLFGHPWADDADWLRGQLKSLEEMETEDEYAIRAGRKDSEVRMEVRGERQGYIVRLRAYMEHRRII